jgi:hypothetical protein
MIGDYVDAYGSITRAQAATLCQLSPTQAQGRAQAAWSTVISCDWSVSAAAARYVRA